MDGLLRIDLSWAERSDAHWVIWVAIENLPELRACEEHLDPWPGRHQVLNSASPHGGGPGFHGTWCTHLDLRFLVRMRLLGWATKQKFWRLQGVLPGGVAMGYGVMQDFLPLSKLEWVLWLWPLGCHQHLEDPLSKHFQKKRGMQFCPTLYVPDSNNLIFSSVLIVPWDKLRKISFFCNGTVIYNG